jgi:hypothetical protein
MHRRKILVQVFYGHTQMLFDLQWDYILKNPCKVERKIRPVGTILRMGEKGIKENDEGGEFNIYCKHFCKRHNVPPVQ